jgi:hypothetical protein
MMMMMMMMRLVLVLEMVMVMMMMTMMMTMMMVMMLYVPRSYEEVTVVYRRRYLLRHVAIEVFLSNGENHLITFEAPRVRDDVCQRLLAR